MSYSYGESLSVSKLTALAKDIESVREMVVDSESSIVTEIFIETIFKVKEGLSLVKEDVADVERDLVINNEGDKRQSIVSDLSTRISEVAGEIISASETEQKKVLEMLSQVSGIVSLLPDQIKETIGSEIVLLNTISNEILNKGIEAKDIPLVIEVIRSGNDLSLLSQESLNQILIAACQSDLLELAHFVLTKGADQSILESDELTGGMKECSIDWLKKMSKKPPLTVETLDHYALGLGFGYKTTNLHIMNNLLLEVSEGLKVCEVEVPSLIGVSDTQVWQHINKEMTEIKELWNKFLDTFEYDEGEKLPTTIPPEGQAILHDIQDKIVDYFESHEFESFVLNDWLRGVDSEFVIVRSTGREDSDISANAGGNASIPYVAPEGRGVSEAMSCVVASYFGEKSIIQRLQSGDSTVFTDPPFIPVLVQKMVCETNSGGEGSKLRDIPSSGVLFTGETGKADGVTVVNAAFGSNEGVVASLVRVATYLVHDNGVYTVQRDLNTRYVHKQLEEGDYEVSSIPNSASLRNSSPLSDEVVRELSKVAQFYGQKYGEGSLKAMDMEYTISFKGDTPVIYPLQIRPLVQGGHEEKTPSFLSLDYLKGVGEDNKVSVMTLLDGGSAVVEVEDVNSQVIFADDLPQALFKYQNCENPEDIRMIVSRQTAPITSHECVTLKPTGIPLMVIEDPEQFSRAREILASGDSSMLCVQRSVIVAGEREHNADMVQDGLISYPGPLEYSIPEVKVGSYSIMQPTLNAEDRVVMLKKLIDRSEEYFSAELTEEVVVELKELDIHELIDRVASSESVVARQALAYLVKIMFNNSIGQYRGKSGEELLELLGDGNIDSFRGMIRLYEHTFSLVNKNMVPALIDEDRCPPHSMNRLFHLKPIQAILFQLPSQVVRNGESYSTYLQSMQATKKIIAIHEKYGLPINNENTWLLNFGNYAFRRDTKEVWHRFLSDASINDEERIMLIVRLKEFTKLDVAELFLNVTFNDILKGGGTAKDKYHKILSMGESSQEMFAWIGSKKLVLEELEFNIGNFSNPLLVERSLSDVVAIFQDMGILSKDGGEVEIVERFKGCEGKLEKLAILRLLKRAVKYYDVCIKGVSGSVEYSSFIDKGKDFSKMLLVCRDMMSNVMNILDEESALELMRTGAEKGKNEINMNFKGFETYLDDGSDYYDSDDEIKKSVGFKDIVDSFDDGSVTETDAEKQFEARGGFNVDACAVGSHISRDEGCIAPSRLEEYFTVFHQTMERIISTESSKLGLDQDVLPEQLQRHSLAISEMFGVSIGSVTKNGSKLEVVFDVPLNMHASQIVLTQDLHKESNVVVKLVTFGSEEHDRWKKVALHGVLISSRLGVKLSGGKSPAIDYENLKRASFELDIPEDYESSDLDNLYNCLHSVIENTRADLSGRPDLKTKEEKFFKGILGVEKYESLPLFLNFYRLDSFEAWKQLPEDVFSKSFYMNLLLLDHFTEEGDLEMQLRIIKNSLQGLKEYGLSDYDPADGYEVSYKSKYSDTSSLMEGMIASLNHSLSLEGLSEDKRVEVEELLTQLQ
jgi:hypothetical protein